VRHTFVRSARGYARQESVVPWRGYVFWAGGTLLLVFLATDALMPPPAATRYFGEPAKMPTIRIHSEVKGPEKVIIDTGGFVRPELGPEQVEASGQNTFLSTTELQVNPPKLEQTVAGGKASASQLTPGVRQTFAQLTPRAEVAPVKQASRRHPSHSARARSSKGQPR
jgi:hypothetical protein